MARSRNNLFTQGTQGAIGKQMVFKNVNGKTIVSKYPDMSQVEYTKEQLKYKAIFAKAVEYARKILKDPVQKAAYEQKIRNDKRKRGNSVYHIALKEFMAMHSRKVDKTTVEQTLRAYLQAYTLTDRQAEAIKYLIKQGKLTNSIYQRINEVSKPTATRDLQTLVQQGVIIASKVKGAGATYSLAPLEKGIGSKISK